MFGICTGIHSQHKKPEYHEVFFQILSPVQFFKLLGACKWSDCKCDELVVPDLITCL